MNSARGNFGSKRTQECKIARTKTVVVFDEKFNNDGIDYDGSSSEEIKIYWPDGGLSFNTTYRVTAAFGGYSPIPTPIPEGFAQFFLWVELNNKLIPGSGVSTMLTPHAGPVTVSGNILLAAATGDKLRLCWTANDTEVTTVYQKQTEQTPEIYSAHVALETIRS